MWHTVLSPVIAVVSAMLAGAHTVLSHLGLEPDSAPAWTAAIVLVVLAVRLAMLPLVVRQVRLTHRATHAQPELAAIRQRYQGRRDQASLLRQAQEVRAVNAQHGISLAATLPTLAHVPALSAVYVLLRDVSAGLPMASISLHLATSASQASVAGVQLGSTLSSLVTAGLLGPAAGLVGVCLLLGGLAWATQRYLVLPNLAAHTAHGPAGQMQRWMPAVAGIGAGAAAAMVPAGVVVYLLASALWTAGQQGVITRFWPTPTSPAATRRA